MLDFSWVLTILVGLVTWYLTRQWLKVKSLPPGPYPWPIVGNLLSFRSVAMSTVMNRYHEKYGGVYTVWFGSIPFVFVADYQLIREALIEKKTDFAGRFEISFVKEILGDHMNISSTTYSRPWDVLRKMGHAAIRKYANSDYLPPVVDELTEECVKKMVSEKEPFNSRNHIHLLVFNIMASTVMGQRFKEDDPNILIFRNSMEVFEQFIGKGLLGILIPILRPFLSRSNKAFTNTFNNMLDFINGKLKEHLATYQPNDMRDMIDSILTARDELVAELGPENTAHLNDGNIFHLIMDLFATSIDTTVSIIRWLMLYVTMFPEVQDKMIQEIQDNIGNRIPTQGDRKRCPYVMAAITEITRLHAVAPFGLPHTTIRDTQIGEHIIREGQGVMFHYGAINNDPTYWKNPDRFLPERFLETDGQLNDARLSHYLPFGLGRRSCVGEKLAIENIFMVVVGIFKRCRLTLKKPPEGLMSEVPIMDTPKPHTILATALN